MEPDSAKPRPAWPHPGGWDAASLACLRAAIDRLVPADADPGALALGADLYVVVQLGRDAAAWADPIRDGLAALDGAARRDGAPDFAALSAARRDAHLRNVETAAWFAALADLTAEGVYADPGQGGNRDAEAWRMIGYAHRLPEGPSGPAARSPRDGA